MTARHWLTLVVALCASMAVTGAEASGEERRRCVGRAAARTRFPRSASGSRRPAASATHCYNPNPWIPLRTGAIVSGTVVGPGECGVPGIEVTSWKAVKTIKCTERK